MSLVNRRYFDDLGNLWLLNCTNKVLVSVSELLIPLKMIKTDRNSQHSTSLHSTLQETSPMQLSNKPQCSIFHKTQLHHDTKKQPQKFSIPRKIVFLNSKEQVESLNQSSSSHSDQMDIDQENDIVNELEFFPGIEKNEEQDEVFISLSPKDRILYANTKKHQGNEYFKDNNLQDAIDAYKFGLSLLKPESFAQASAKDCFLMAELTSNILYNMGTCYFILLSYRYAIRFYDQAILIKPNYGKAIHNRALCHLEEGNLLYAFNDIRLALTYDSHNLSIQSDLKKIQDEYFGLYGHQTMKKPSRTLKLLEDKPMSKSMIENNVSDVDNSDDTAASTIKKENTLRNNIEKTKLTQDKFQETKTSSKQVQVNTPKQRFKSFYGKRFFHNQTPKTPRQIKSLNRSMGSPKFRPFVQNRTLNSENKLLSNTEGKKMVQQRVQNSSKGFDRDNRIFLVQQSFGVQVSDDNPHKNLETKKKRKESKQKSIYEGKSDYWGYIPIVLVTGYGLYHSFKAVLGK